MQLLDLTLCRADGHRFPTVRVFTDPKSGPLLRAYVELLARSLDAQEGAQRLAGRVPPRGCPTRPPRPRVRLRRARRRPGKEAVSRRGRASEGTQPAAGRRQARGAVAGTVPGSDRGGDFAAGAGRRRLRLLPGCPQARTQPAGDTAARRAVRRDDASGTSADAANELLDAQRRSSGHDDVTTHGVTATDREAPTSTAESERLDDRRRPRRHRVYARVRVQPTLQSRTVRRAGAAGGRSPVRGVLRPSGDRLRASSVAG